MSKQEMERFETALRSDEELVKALCAEARDLETVVAFARSRGFDITVEEALAERESSKLTDQELETVAGGFTLIPNVWHSPVGNIDIGTLWKDIPSMVNQAGNAVGNAASDVGNTLENWGKIYVLGDPEPTD